MESNSILNNKQFISIFLIAFLVYFSNGMLAQTLPKYAFDLGATSQIIGVLSGTFAMCALLLRPVSGLMVDNEDRRLLLRITIGVILVSVTGLTFSKQVWLLIVFRGINGLGWGIGSTLCMTIASSCFSKEKLGSGIGIYGLGQTIAQAIAPVIGLNVAQAYSYNFLYQFNVIICAAAFVLTYFIKLDTSSKKERKYSVSLKEMVCLSAIPPSVVTLCNSIAQASVTAFLVIFANSISVTQIGVFFTVQAAIVLVARPLWGKLTDKYGCLKVIIPCEFLIASGLLTIFFSQALWQFLLAAVLVGAGTAGNQPVLMAECIRRAPPEQRGRASNTSYMGTDIGGVVGSNLAGLLVTLIGYRNLYLIFILPILMATFMYTVFEKRRVGNL
ncbi:MAG: arabinose efflux permease family protein [Firmicutes bacterium]|nr:arabinose efflux permease family protein [Bacillota bacterium]